MRFALEESAQGGEKKRNRNCSRKGEARKENKKEEEESEKKPTVRHARGSGENPAN